MFAKVFYNWLNPLLRALAGFKPLKKCWYSGNSTQDQVVMGRWLVYLTNLPPLISPVVDYPAANFYNR